MSPLDPGRPLVAIFLPHDRRPDPEWPDGFRYYVDAMDTSKFSHTIWCAPQDERPTSPTYGHVMTSCTRIHIYDDEYEPTAFPTAVTPTAHDLALFEMSTLPRDAGPNGLYASANARKVFDDLAALVPDATERKDALSDALDVAERRLLKAEDAGYIRDRHGLRAAAIS